MVQQVSLQQQNYLPHPGSGWEGRYVPGMQWRKEAVDLLVVCGLIIGSVLFMVGETK